MTKMMKMFYSSHALAASVLIAAFPIVSCIEDSEPVEADTVSDQDMLGSTDTTEQALADVPAGGQSLRDEPEASAYCVELGQPCNSTKECCDDLYCSGAWFDDKICRYRN